MADIGTIQITIKADTSGFRQQINRGAWRLWRFHYAKAHPWLRWAVLPMSRMIEWIGIASPQTPRESVQTGTDETQVLDPAFARRLHAIGKMQSHER